MPSCLQEHLPFFLLSVTTFLYYYFNCFYYYYYYFHYVTWQVHGEPSQSSTAFVKPTSPTIQQTGSLMLPAAQANLQR